MLSLPQSKQIRLLQSSDTIAYTFFNLITGAFPLSGSDVFVLGSDMVFNIEYLLDLIPQAERDTERKQVRFCFTL